ncbi:MAG: hypothetical protein OCD00_03560 [Colwellia sp.]
MEKIKYSLIILVTLLLTTFINPSHATNCEYIDNNSSKTLSAKSQYCLSLPLSTNEPLVIVQAESGGNPYNKFKVEVLASDNANSSILESFTSNGMSVINTASSTTQMGTATIRVKPIGDYDTSQIKVMYGNLNGLDTLIIFNKNIPDLPIIDEPPRECIIPPGQMFCELNQTYAFAFSMMVQSSSSSCNIGNSSPTMPSTFDLNDSIKKAETYKSSLGHLI